jgi:transcription-repair coupling factor (superfamily II helicase)
VPITILPVAAALLRVAPGEHYRQLALKLRAGDELPLDVVLAHLESIGYERREPVEMVGEYSVRGGILDVFSPEASKPVRIDMFGDQVDSIRRFDVESQRSVLKIEECTPRSSRCSRHPSWFGTSPSRSTARLSASGSGWSRSSAPRPTTPIEFISAGTI